MSFIEFKEIDQTNFFAQALNQRYKKFFRERQKHFQFVV